MSFENDELKAMNAAPGKGDFNLKFTPDNGDETPPPVHGIAQSPGVPGQVENTTAKALEGFFQMIDIGISFAAKMSKGTIEYEGCSKDEIAMMAEQGSKSEAIAGLAQMENMPTWMAIGITVGTYGKHVKIHKKEKEDEPKQVESNLLTEREAQLIESLAKKKIADARQVPKESILDAENSNPIPQDNSSLEVLSSEEQMIKDKLDAGSVLTPEQRIIMQSNAKKNSDKIKKAEIEAKEKAAKKGVFILDD